MEKGLLRQLVLAEGRTVFDPRLEPHHHFIDDETGRIEDVPWDAVRVGEVKGLEGLRSSRIHGRDAGPEARRVPHCRTRPAP